MCPIQTDTRASSAANGLASSPARLGGTRVVSPTPPPLCSPGVPDPSVPASPNTGSSQIHRRGPARGSVAVGPGTHDRAPAPHRVNCVCVVRRATAPPTPPRSSPYRLPFCLQGPANHRVDQHLDLGSVGVMCAELAAFIGIKTALKQCANGSISAQSCLAARISSSISVSSSCNAAASSNSPPLNHGASINPTSPPLFAMAPNNWPTSVAKKRGLAPNDWQVIDALQEACDRHFETMPAYAWCMRARVAAMSRSPHRTFHGWRDGATIM